MANCSNCKKTLSCGCQKRKASNGVEVCSNCIKSYEANLTQKTIKPLSTQQTEVWGANRYKSQIK